VLDKNLWTKLKPEDVQQRGVVLDHSLIPRGKLTIGGGEREPRPMAPCELPLLHSSMMTASPVASPRACASAKSASTNIVASEGGRGGGEREESAGERGGEVYSEMGTPDLKNGFGSGRVKVRAKALLQH